MQIVRGTSLNQRPGGKLATTAVTNEIVNAVNGMQVPGIRTSSLQQIFEDAGVWFVWDSGPNGEANYTDARYWMRRAYISNDDNGDPTDEVELTEIDISKMSASDKLLYWVTATNLSESTSSSHGLAKKTPVVFPSLEADAATPQVWRWVFQSGGGGVPKPTLQGQVPQCTSDDGDWLWQLLESSP